MKLIQHEKQPRSISMQIRTRRKTHRIIRCRAISATPAMCRLVLYSTLDANIFSWDDPCANCTHHPGSVSTVLHPLSFTQPIQQSRRAVKTNLPKHPVGLAPACRLAAAQENVEKADWTAANCW